MFEDVKEIEGTEIKRNLGNIMTSIDVMAKQLNASNEYIYNSTIK